MHHIILVPGFLAFSDLGALRYFEGVEAVVREHFESRGELLEVHHATPPPTSSIRARAGALVEMINTLSLDSKDSVHLIGHSTGGLDLRLATSPGASLHAKLRPECFARIRTLATVSTPHHGTPLARSMLSFLAGHWLRHSSMLGALLLRRLPLPLRALIFLGDLIATGDDMFGLKHTVLDEIYRKLLRRLPKETEKNLADYLASLASDRSLLHQLGPDSMDLFNATMGDPPSVRYGSVLTWSPAPTLLGVTSHSPNPYTQATYGLYALLYRHTARATKAYSMPLSESQLQAVEGAMRRKPTPKDNDGVVPTDSQAWGEIIHVACADHLDVIGHYERKSDGKHSHADWLASRSNFHESEFQETWERVASFLLQF